MCNFADHWCEEALPSPCEGPRRGCPGQHKRVMPKQHDLIVKNPSPSTDPSMRLRFLISLIFLRLSMMVWRCLQERPFSPQLSSVRLPSRPEWQLRSLRQSASAFTSALRDAFSHQMEHRRGSDLRDLDCGFLWVSLVGFEKILSCSYFSWNQCFSRKAGNLFLTGGGIYNTFSSQDCKNGLDHWHTTWSHSKLLVSNCRGQQLARVQD